ncbi:MAG: glycosyltransferase family 2 protein [Anaerolineales bacterium]|nr:glycosyltransferase family 2 protein [Anaerolineales bacterium]MCB9126375.1 glycosyltransferase family 2 protein [Ardenticatenales bacterium]MCB9171536.1 glycosyltransferase family 2 protein [Ardenticatenales bacterium]
MVAPALSPAKLLILIPALNEAAMIGAVVRRAHRALPDADILVIDDGSSDETAARATDAGALVLSLPFNLGIGGAVQCGLKFACHHDYEIVLRMDGDGQHEASDMLPLLDKVRNGEADVAFGSRFLDDGCTMSIPPSRQLGILLFARIVSLLTGRRATDTTSGFCVFNRRAIQTLATYMPQDYPEVEGRLILHKAHLHAVELPAQMHMRTTGVSSINRWRSIYYALKVSIAVLITAIKEISPAMPVEDHAYANSARPAYHGLLFEPSTPHRDHPIGPQA